MAWTKGKSGNPSGSQKRREIGAHIERCLLEAVDGGEVTKARKIAQQVVDMAVDGDKWAIQFVTERTEGKPDQHVSITRSIRELTDEELSTIASGSGEGIAGEAGGEEVAGVVH